MSQLILLNESNISRRVLYLWAMQSNGTTPAQFEAGGQPSMSVAGLAKWNSAGTLLSMDTANGEYQVRLGTSDVSVLGPGVLRYSSGTALEVSVPFQVVAFDPYDSAKLGLTSISTFDPSAVSVGLKAVTHSGATIAGVLSGVTLLAGNYSNVTISGVNSGVTLLAGNYSNVTISGVNSGVTLLGGTFSNVTVQVNGIAPATYSGVTVGVNNLAPATYSGVTVGINNIAAGAYSGVTIDGVTRVNSSVTIVNADYSGVTVRASNVTIATGGIVAASFAASAVDAAALATDAGQEIADRILVRNIASGADGGRDVRSALYALRNKVALDGSTGTVYQTDDTTASWTMSIATVSTNSGLINVIDPG